MEISVQNNIMVKETIEYVSEIVMKRKEMEAAMSGSDMKQLDVLIKKDAFDLRYDKAAMLKAAEAAAVASGGSTAPGGKGGRRPESIHCLDVGNNSSKCC